MNTHGSSIGGRLSRWLEQPLSALWCVVGWCVSTIAFVGIVATLGGPAYNDTYETVFSTWAVQHGQIACAFPPGFKATAPLYPLVSGGIAAAARIGHTVPFPGRAVLGADCHHGFLTINSWSLRTGATHATIQIGYLSWFALLAGVVSVLRATGRARCRWEPAVAVLVACLPPVWLCVEGTFHPEDLVAMGLALVAVALALRSSWGWAGLVAALAVLSQQFALLVAVPLFVLAPPRHRRAYGATVVGTLATAIVVLSALTSGDGARAIVFGTGATGGVGGTIVWEMNLHNVPLLVVSRITPVLLSALLAWWVVRRFGHDERGCIVLAVVAFSLGLRLLFDQQLFGYYFMALCVTLVLLDVASRHFRETLLAWLATVSMVSLTGSTALDRLAGPGPTVLNTLLPVSVIILAVLLITRELRRGIRGWAMASWIAMIVAALVVWQQTDLVGQPPTWLWQFALVPLGLGLAVTPLVGRLDRRTEIPTTSGASPEGRLSLP